MHHEAVIFSIYIKTHKMTVYKGTYSVAFPVLSGGASMRSMKKMHCQADTGLVLISVKRQSSGTDVRAGDNRTKRHSADQQRRMVFLRQVWDRGPSIG